MGVGGGDEFIVLSPETSLQDASEMGRRIVEKICEHKYVHDINISASIGVSECVPTDNIHLIISRVDKLMYESKKIGGNNVISHF